MEWKPTRRQFTGSLLAAPMVLSARAFASGSADPALSEALRSHFEFSAGFRQKFKSGTYSVPKGASDAALVDGALKALQDRLAALDRTTYALLHHIDRAGHLRAWLISSDGVLLASRSDAPYRELSYLRPILRVDTRMQTRAPIMRTGAPVILPSDDPVPEFANPDEALAFAADQLLGSEIAPALAGFSGRLIILPVADTGTAPYAALPLSGEQRMVDRIATLIVPDIETLIDPERVFDVGDMSFRNPLVFGNPDLSYDPEYIFPDLPFAREEARTVGQLIGMDERSVALGEEASLDAFLARAGRADGPEFIHIASHAISNGVNPMDGSFVGLSEGRLTGKILRSEQFGFWAVRHPLVILSGCQTALGKIFAGGTYGLSRAFFSAGAAQILASLWNVSDEATNVLMSEAADRIFLGYPAEFALQRAQQKAARIYEADYAAWASFSAYGIPGA